MSDRPINRRRFLVASASAGVVTLRAHAAADPAARSVSKSARLATIGIVHMGAAPEAPVVTGLRAGLKELGYAEGRDIALEVRAGRSDYATAVGATRQLVRAHARLIVSAGTLATKAAQEAAGDVPIVFTQVGEPVAAGFVKSLLHPGGNMTGFSHLLAENTGKRLELLKELVPACRTVLVMFDPTNATSRAAVAAARDAAKKLDVRLHERRIWTRDDVLKSLREIDRKTIDAMLVVPDSLVVNAGYQIIDKAFHEKLPVMFHEDTWVNRGGLASYGPSFVDLGRRAATYVDRILKGAKPADLPVEQPTRFDLVLNLKTAGALGVTIPQQLLLLADRIIE